MKFTMQNNLQGLFEAVSETFFYRRSNSLTIRFGSRGFRLSSSTHQPGDAVLVY